MTDETTLDYVNELQAYMVHVIKLNAEIERLREHLISALDTLKDAEVCDDNCAPCNEARAELEQSK